MTEFPHSTELPSERPRGVFISYSRGDRGLEALLGVHKRRQVVLPPVAHKPRKPTLVSVAKQASKAAIPVARYEVKPDGTVVVVTGEPEQQQSNEVDDWIAKHADKTQRH